VCAQEATDDQTFGSHPAGVRFGASDGNVAANFILSIETGGGDDVVWINGSAYPPSTPAHCKRGRCGPLLTHTHTHTHEHHTLTQTHTHTHTHTHIARGSQHTPQSLTLIPPLPMALAQPCPLLWRVAAPGTPRLTVDPSGGRNIVRAQNVTGAYVLQGGSDSTEVLLG
jgi:hypothetical protein